MLSEEDKNYLFDQLEGLIGKRPLFYLKFCSEEKFAKDVCNGDLYANTPDWFRMKEIESGERGQGDSQELIQIFHAEKAWIEDNETGDLFMTVTSADWSLRFGSDDDTPIVSFVGIPIRDMIVMDADESRVRFLFPFTEDEYASMEQKFGKYCVIIGARELEEKLRVFHKTHNLEYLFDQVIYCPQNRIDRMEAFNRGKPERYLYKNDDLAYQREYRFVPCIEMPEDHFIRVGQLETARVFMSSQLKDFIFCLGYKTSPKTKGV